MKILCSSVLTLACILAGTSANAQTVKELQQELAAKNARIRQLEDQLREREAQDTRAVVFSKRSMAAGPTTFSKQQKVVQAKAPQNEASSAGSPPIPVEVRASSDRSPPRIDAAPSDRDDDELDRALERTLVREGALVLPPWVYELTPQFSYAHWDKVQDPFVRNSYGAALTLRVGLPWASQIAVSLPYGYSELRDGSSSSGLGDVGVQLSKELLVESGWHPNLVGSVGWTSPTRFESTLAPVPYVSGFQAGLTASKRLDPLVVFGSVSYFSSAAREFAGTRYDPADVFATRVGGSLAISPATSVTTGFSLAYLLNAHPSDFIVPGSDTVLSSVDIGLTTILWKRTLLNVTAQFGVTGHVPDFRLITSIPVRF